MKNKMRILHVVLCCLWSFTIVFSEVFKAIPNIFMFLLVFISFFLIEKRRMQKLWIWYGVFLGTFMLAGAVNHSLQTDFNYIKNFFILPFVALATTPLSEKGLNCVKISFVSACLSMAFISGLMILYSYATVKGFTFENGEIVHTLLLGERIYIGLYMGIAAFITFNYIRFSKQPKWVNWTSTGAFALIVLFVILISSRIGFLCLLILATIEVYKLVCSKKLNWFALFAGFVVLSTVVYNTSLFDRIAYRTAYNEPFLTSLLEYEARAEIWPCAVKTVNTQTVWFGNGYEDSQNLLVNCYNGIEKESKRVWFLERKFNSHNQFINVLMGSGIFSLLALMWFLFNSAWKQMHNLHLLGLLACLVTFMLIENALYRQSGLYIAVFVFLLMQRTKLETYK